MTTVVCKPPHLLMQIVIYEVAQLIARQPDQGKTDAERQDLVARNMLMAIGRDAPPDVVYKLLAAIGGPTCPEDALDQLRAVFRSASGDKAAGLQ
jgi:hypothetical protein